MKELNELFQIHSFSGVNFTQGGVMVLWILMSKRNIYSIVTGFAKTDHFPQFIELR